MTLGRRRAKRSQRARVCDWAEYLPVLLFSFVLRVTPIGLAYRLWEGLLLAGYAVLPRPRARARGRQGVIGWSQRPS